MEAVSLLREAEDAGLVVRVDGDRLVVRGPKSAGAIAERLLDHKAEVIEALSAEWDTEMLTLIRWFLDTHPPTEPFELSKGVTVIRPALWWTALRRDIAAGPRGPRARYGALQEDLRRLKGLPNYHLDTSIPGESRSGVWGAGLSFLAGLKLWVAVL